MRNPDRVPLPCSGPGPGPRAHSPQCLRKGCQHTPPFRGHHPVWATWQGPEDALGSASCQSLHGKPRKASHVSKTGIPWLSVCLCDLTPLTTTPVTSDLCGMGASGRQRVPCGHSPWGRPRQRGARTTQRTVWGQAHIKGVFIQARGAGRPPAQAVNPGRFSMLGPRVPASLLLIKSPKAQPEQLGETGQPSNTF